MRMSEEAKEKGGLKSHVEVNLAIGLAVVGAIRDVGLTRKSGAIGLRGDDDEMEGSEEELDGGIKGLHLESSRPASAFACKGDKNVVSAIEDEPMPTTVISMIRKAPR